MTLDHFRRYAIQPALALLPPSMHAIEAEALVLAIALQESKVQHRRQVGGPARSYVQFEHAGVAGVLRHPSSRPHALALCAALDVEAVPGAVYTAVEYQDVLAAGFARLLLWTLPQALPRRDQVDQAWSQYLAAWRPGKPHRHTWDAHFGRAWQVVIPR